MSEESAKPVKPADLLQSLKRDDWQEVLEAKVEKLRKEALWTSADGNTIRVKLPEGSVGNPYVYLPDVLGKK